MKITLIHGQIHHGSTYHVSSLLAKKLNGEITEIFLPKDFNDVCVGCGTCINIDEKLCPHYHNLKQITKAIDECDVLILDSPTYVYHLSSGMKILLEHYGYRWLLHRPSDKMFHKLVVCISTARGGGQNKVCKDMADSASWWGASKIYKYGIALMTSGWENVSQKKKDKIDKDTSKLANKIIKKSKHVSTSLKVKIFMPIMKIVVKSQKDSIEYKYWKQKGWLDDKPNL